MKTVWKYPISLEFAQNIEMPEGAEILCLHKQGSRHEDEIYIWCLVDTDKPKTTRKFQFFSTGDEILCKECTYIGTLWMMNGTYILHLFEIMKG